MVATFGDLPTALAVFAMVLLALYLALFPAVAAVVTSRLISRAGGGGLFVAPAAWVATEYLRGTCFGGFPWVPLGNSQVTVLPVAQLASVLGVYGLSALVALRERGGRLRPAGAGPSRFKALAATAVLLVGVGAWGAWRVADGALTRQGDAGTRRSGPGQHRAGETSGTRGGAAHLHHLHRHDARRRSAAARST